jgi:aspartyl-tRNA(Asn)/glutamyl-tRNA(Gln) amidotransferase subunit B
VADVELSQYFEEVLAEVSDYVGLSPKIVGHWVTGEVLAAKLNGPSGGLPISPKRLAGLLKLLGDETISGKIAKVVFQELLETADDAMVIVQKRGLVQVTNIKQVEEVVAKVISDHPGQLKEYLEGKTKLFAFFVGQVMKVSQGRLNPHLVNQVIKKHLDSLAHGS